ncbi:xanthine dehydrogenase accessory factor [Streptomyces griseomycini]|uniref:XdhC family protein n=1 Tax=Streptomyces griseomycini TaxID=66895 RepID=UPI0018758622|nr:XdhC/CoxI family protein [Streptomyces griseomycini]GGQ40204.1 xanthine dehydrogenase accessory factor [Streptomyces griseomycini]
MNDAWQQLYRLWESGTPGALATVVSAYGSAPRQPGAIMVCTPQGKVTGSVSGGCVEGAVYDKAQEALRYGTAALERYGVGDDDAGAVGLTCGGTIEVLVERVDRSSFPELEDLLTHRRAGTAVALATLLDDASAPGSGRHLVCWADGTSGSTGSSALDEEIAREAKRLLAQGRSGVIRPTTAATDGPKNGTAGSPRVFVNCLTPPPRMLIYGANDFAAALARQGALLGYRVTVCDARPVFTTPERFPDADDVVVAWPHHHLAAEAAAGRIDARTAVVSLTHDPKFDHPLLKTALRLDLAYTGAMGSRRTAARRVAGLRAAGLPEEQLTRLSSPAGLDLTGTSPAETALSITAEILHLRNGGSRMRLRDIHGPIHRKATPPQQPLLEVSAP